jgi:hypothetical protein
MNLPSTLFTLSIILSMTASAKAQSEVDQTCPGPTDNAKIEKFSAMVEIAAVGYAKGCTIRVHRSSDGSTGKWDSPLERQYVINSNGAFMVANLYTDHPNAKNSEIGDSRLYYIFPRSERPSYKKLLDGQLEVKLASGDRVRFSSQTGRIAGFTGMKWTEDPAISRANKGGLDLKPGANRLLLDTGYAPKGTSHFYRSPRKKYGKNGKLVAVELAPALESTFIDSNGTRCSVSDADIFDYTWGLDHGIKVYSGDADLKPDSELKQVLEKKCPRLDTTALKNDKALPLSDAPENEAASSRSGE